MTLPDSVWTNVPTAYSIAYVSDYLATEATEGHEYKLNAIALGTYGSIGYSFSNDNTSQSVFTKNRVVSTGVRFFKTSSSETESGQLDMHYSRDGANIDDSANLRSLFSRPTANT